MVVFSYYEPKIRENYKMLCSKMNKEKSRDKIHIFTIANNLYLQHPLI